MPYRSISAHVIGATGAPFSAAGAAAWPAGKLVGKLVTIPANAPFAVAPAPKTISSSARASHNGLLLALVCDIYLPCSLLWITMWPITRRVVICGVGRWQVGKLEGNTFQLLTCGVSTGY